MSIWVTPAFYESKRGIKACTLKSWADQGKLESGVHFMIEGKKRLFNLKAIDEWLTIRASEQGALAASKSAGGTKTSSIAKRSTSARQRRTRPS